MTNPLFESVVKETGLNPRIAPFVVRRVCASLGFPAAAMTKDKLIQSLDAIGAAIRVYKPSSEADEAVERIRRLATTGSWHSSS